MENATHQAKRGGIMGALIDAQDFSTSKLGPRSNWPQSLRTALSICLSSRFPMVIFWGVDLCVLYNDGYIPIFGKKHPEVLGKTGFEAWGEVWDVISPMLGTVMSRGDATWSEDMLLVLTRNGFPEECYFTWSYSPIDDETGGVGGVLTVIVETTTRVLSERRLLTLRALGEEVPGAKDTHTVCKTALHTLAQNHNDVCYVAIYLSEGSEFTLCCQSELDDHEAARPERVELDDEIPWPLGHATKLGEAIVVPTQAVLGPLPGGAWPEPSHTAVVLPLTSSDAAHPYGALVVGISPRLELDTAYNDYLTLVANQLASALANARAHEEERKRAEALAEIDHAKTAFFSNVSHEFRTPLTLILGPTEDALGSGHPLHGEDLETVYRNELRLLKLVNALLDFSRIEAGRMRATYIPTDIGERTMELASVFRSAIERAGLRYRVECERIEEPIYLDVDMWEKIVLNLLSNALKFTLEGEIEVCLAARDGEVALTVHDTGVGVPADELPRIFERFHRVEGREARTHEGSGIGLALVHDLVRLHGGRVEVQSEVGVGTAFTVFVPKGTRHLDPERISNPGARSPAVGIADAFVQEALRWLPHAVAPLRDTSPQLPARDDGPRGRVLVADDNADMREYVTRLLHQRWDVDAVADGEAALVAARAAPPDLILSDVMIPKLDGFSLLAELRRDPLTRSIPVVMLSARAGEDARIDGLRAGADDYLVKPFSARELLARIETHLELRKARDETAHERQRLLALFMKVPAAIAIHAGPDHVFEFANDMFRAIFAREPIGKPLRAVFPDLFETENFQNIERAFERGERVEYNELAVTLTIDGAPEQRFYSGIVEPWREADGSIGGVLQLFVDVTAQVVAQRERDHLLERERHARVEAEAANRAKDEFLSVVSHELRTPLNAMMGWARLLLDDEMPAEKQRHGLEVIERNAYAQAQLIEDLLDVSRIISGKVRIDPKPIRPIQFVKAAVESVRLAANAKGVRLQLALDPTADEILGDHDRLQQVAWNLLSNAIKFTPQDGRVLARLHRAGAHVEFTVEDTGQGIPPDFMPYLFERFRQVDASFTRSRGGLGLGLAIARHLVELHGGTIHAHSDGADRGARFTVTLPINPMRAHTIGDQAVGAPARATSRRADARSDLAGIRVLVVDDEPDARDILREILERAHADVTLAASASEAMDLLARNTPAVIVSDIGMPGEDGLSLIPRIRSLPVERGGRIPAVALTAYARAIDRKQTLMAGFDIHLGKPVDPEELVAVIANLVARHSS